MIEEKNWYLVCTKPKSEKKVGELLTKRGVCTYMPLYRATNDTSGSNRYTKLPLFNRYIFVYINLEKQKFTIQRTDGFNNFVFWLGEPVKITLSEIESIRSFLEMYEDVRLKKVEVAADKSEESKYEKVFFQVNGVGGKQLDFVRVTLPNLGFSMVAELKSANVELLNFTSSKYHGANIASGSYG